MYKGLFPLGLRSDSQASRRTKCCESDSYSATHLCWVLNSVSPTRSRLLVVNRQQAVKAGGVAYLQASMTDFQQEGTLQLIEERNFL